MKSQLKVNLEALKWSQAKLSRAIGVSQTTITTWVHGRVPTPKVVLMYTGLLIGIKELVEGQIGTDL